MNDISHGVRRYLEFVMRSHGLSARALAIKSGISASTLTRFLNDINYKFNVSNTTLDKIARSTGENPAPFINGADFLALNQSVFGTDKGEENELASSVITIGELSPGVWREPQPGEFDSHFHSIHINGFLAGQTFACLVRGLVIEDLAEDGDYLFCVKTDAYLKAYNPADESLVIVQRQRDGDLIELTARLAQKIDGGLLLRHAQFARGPRPKNLRLKSFDETEQVRVLGFVMFAVRYPKTRQILTARSLGPTE